MSKPKLLITMGCSFTEGVGCYDVSKMDELKSYVSLPYEQFIHQTNNFHKLGWPNRVGKKLGYDKVINLGLAGSSNSGQVKQFSEKYLDKDFSEYEVLIIWLLTEPSRISFYSGGTILDIVPKSNNTLYNEYVRTIQDITIDTTLEEIFYIKMMEQICENKGYSLLISPLTSYISHDSLYSIYKSKYYLNPSPISPTEEIFDRKYLCDIPKGDTHFNELGYEKLSNNIMDNIRKFHPHLITNTPKDDIEWEWDGFSLNWNELI